LAHSSASSAISSSVSRRQTRFVVLTSDPDEQDGAGWTSARRRSAWSAWFEYHPSISTAACRRLDPHTDDDLATQVDQPSQERHRRCGARRSLPCSGRRGFVGGGCPSYNPSGRACGAEPPDDALCFQGGAARPEVAWLTNARPAQRAGSQGVRDRGREVGVVRVPADPRPSLPVGFLWDGRQCR